MADKNKQTVRKSASAARTVNVRISGQFQAKDQAAAYQALADHFLSLAKGKEVPALLPDGIERVTVET